MIIIDYNLSENLKSNINNQIKKSNNEQNEKGYIFIFRNLPVSFLHFNTSAKGGISYQGAT